MRLQKAVCDQNGCSGRRTRAGLSPVDFGCMLYLPPKISKTKKTGLQLGKTCRSIHVLEYGYVPEYDKSGVICGAHNEVYVKLPYCGSD